MNLFLTDDKHIIYSENRNWVRRNAQLATLMDDRRSIGNCHYFTSY